MVDEEQSESGYGTTVRALSRSMATKPSTVPGKGRPLLSRDPRGSYSHLPRQVPEGY